MKGGKRLAPERRVFDLVGRKLLLREVSERATGSDRRTGKEVIFGARQNRHIRSINDAYEGGCCRTVIFGASAPPRDPPPMVPWWLSG